MVTQPEESSALRRYYADHHLLLSGEWILKVLAIVGCSVWAALVLGGVGCESGRGLGAAGAGGVLASAALAALLLPAALARLPARAPLLWLVLDISTSTVMGVLVLVTAVVNAVLCGADTVLAYLFASLGVASSALAVGGAVGTHRAATRRLDRALPAREPRAHPPTEQEV